MHVRALLIVAVMVVAVPACGDSTKTATTPAPNTTTTAATTTSAGSATATVKLVDSPFGKILADGSGQTIYVFTKDSGTTSACTGGCASAWPPVVASGTPTSGDGLAASDLGAVTRDDGTRQVTFSGHPVYTYGGDSGPGEFSGQGSGGSWFVIGADGAAITSATGASAAATTTTVAKKYGY